MVTDQEYLAELDKKLALVRIIRELETERDKLKAENEDLRRQIENLEALDRR